MDLLRVIRTSKSFRKLLLNRNASTVWIAARERAFPNYPEPPDEVSEPFWANLVFGETICEKCGAKNVRKVIFEWRCRLCTSCLKARSVQSISRFERNGQIVDGIRLDDSTMNESRILKLWPDSDKSIVDLIPYGRSRMPQLPIPHSIADLVGLVTGLFRASKNTRFYWNEHVFKIGGMLDTIHLDIDRGTPGAAEDLLLFKQDHLALVTSILEVRAASDIH